LNKPESTAFETSVLVLFTLSRGAESRKKILLELLSGPKNCNQLSKATRLDWWTVKKHLINLMKENLVKNSPFGNTKFYRLSPLGEEITRALQSANGKKSESQGDQV
jgi:predicted transcriptional regulator